MSASRFAIPGRAETPAEKREVVEALLTLWLRAPGLRLGQLLVNALPGGDVERRLCVVEDRPLVSAVARVANSHDERDPNRGVSLDRLEVETLARRVERVSEWLRTSEADGDEARREREAMEVRAFAAEKARDEAQAELAALRAAVAAFCGNASVCTISDCKQHPHDWRTLAAQLPASMRPSEDETP